MPSETPPAAPKRSIDTLLIVLFMLVLWVPTLDGIFHFDWTKARDENRAMARWPKFPARWDLVQPYVEGLEAYFNDHFGCRKCLVQWHGKLAWSLFREKGKPAVLEGKNGWFFYTDAQMIEHYTGELQFTPQQLRDWQTLLETRRDWLAKQGIEYLFIVAPDKQTIYPEELPDWVTKVRPETKLDQFIAYMREHSSVPVLDLRGPLRDAKTNLPTYLKTDTHWNFYGGYVGYCQIMRTPMVRQLGLEPYPLSAFSVTPQSGPGGDLATLLGQNLTETNIYCIEPKRTTAVFDTDSPPPSRPTEDEVTDNPKGKDSIMIFRDSFAGAWVPFLGCNFNKVAYIWHYELDPDRIRRDKPKIVMSEMLERFLDTTDPKQLMLKDALN